jgi:hypothetical protein
MSLFRRKPDAKAKPDPSAEAGAPSEPVSEAPQPDPEPPPEIPTEELFPGVIEAPAPGSVVSGVIEVSGRPAESSETARARLEWSLEGEDWRPCVASRDEFDVFASLEASREPQHIAVVRSLELAEQTRRSLEQAGYARVEISAARTKPWTDGERYRAGWDTRPLPDGECLLRLVTPLADGSELATELVGLLIDNVGPEARPRERLAGRTLEGLVTLIVEAEDAVSGVPLVALEVSTDGQSWQRVAEAHQEPYALQWNTTALDDGSYQVRVAAWDGTGNVSYGEPETVELTSVPSPAELVEPGEFLHGSVNLIARAPDRRTTQMLFQIAAAGSDEWRALGTSRAPFHLPFDSRQLVDGAYELRIESSSASGQSVYSKRFGPYVVDNTPPRVRIVRPRGGAELEGEVEVVVEAADEASGTAIVELAHTEGGEWRPLAELEPDEGEVRGRWQTASAQPGHCELRATARDRAGNESSQVIGVTIVERQVEPEPAPPEPEPEPEQKPAEPSAVHPPSPEAAAHFGAVPSWDFSARKAQPEPPSTEPEEAPEVEAAAEPEPEPEAKAEEEPDREPEPEAEEKGEEAEPAAGVGWRWKAPDREPAPEPKIEAPAEPAPAPEPEPAPEEKAAPEPEPAPEEEPAPEPERAPPAIRLVTEEEAALEPEPEAETAAEPEPQPEKAEGGRVVRFPRGARGWDLWELSDLVETTPGQDSARLEERRQILYHLRDHASLDGRIPDEFGDLIAEAFGELLEDDSDT